MAVVTLRATTDPTFALKGALLRPNVKPRSAITDEKKLGGPLRAIDEFDGWPTLRAALKFCALTFARPGEVRGATRYSYQSCWRNLCFCQTRQSVQFSSVTVASLLVYVTQ